MIHYFLRGAEVSVNRMPTDLLRAMRPILLDEGIRSVAITDIDGVEYKAVAD